MILIILIVIIVIIIRRIIIIAIIRIVIIILIRNPPQQKTNSNSLGPYMSFEQQSLGPWGGGCRGAALRSRGGVCIGFRV